MPDTAAESVPTGKPAMQVAQPRRKRRTAEQTRALILRAATTEFAAHGFAGARIDRIVRRAASNPRLLYEQFGSKSGLYVAALESALGELRAEELRLDIAGLDPLDGLLQLFAFMNSHFERSNHLVRLLATENMMAARYMKRSRRIAEMSSPVLAMIETLLARGASAGKLRNDIDALRLYVLMVALSQFHLSNVHTLSSIFDRDLASPDWRAARDADAKRMLASYLIQS